MNHSKEWKYRNSINLYITYSCLVKSVITESYDLCDFLAVS